MSKNGGIPIHVWMEPYRRLAESEGRNDEIEDDGGSTVKSSDLISKSPQTWVSVDTELPELGKPIWIWSGEFCVFGVRSSTSEHLDEWVWCECLVRWDNQNRRWKVKESWLANEDAKVTHWAELIVPPASKAE